jgi:hypothetical protein
MPVVDIARVITDATQSRWTSKAQAHVVNPASIPKDTEKFLDALEAANVPYLLVGGIALLQYIDGRNTQDIDFILALDDAKKIVGLEIRDSNEFFAQAFYGDLQVDILRPANPLFQKVLDSEITVSEFEGRSLNTVSPKGLIILKLYALPSLYRQGDITRAAIYESDITALLNAHPSPHQELLSALSDHLIKSDLTEVSKILDEISRKLSRFQS